MVDPLDHKPSSMPDEDAEHDNSDVGHECDASPHRRDASRRRARLCCAGALLVGFVVSAIICAAWLDVQNSQTQIESDLDAALERLASLDKERTTLRKELHSLAPNCNCANEHRKSLTNTDFPWMKEYHGGEILPKEKQDFEHAFFPEVLTLPERNVSRPYLVELETHIACSSVSPCPNTWKEQLRTRSDIIWMQQNLGVRSGAPGPFGNGVVPLTPGITTPDSASFKGSPWDPSRAANLRLAFHGHCVGAQEQRLAAKALIDEQVHFVCTHADGDYSSQQLPENERRTKTEAFGDTDFVLISRGDARWSSALMEAVGACAIPIVVADGLSLPFEQIIDWTQLTIRISESDFAEMNSPQDMLAYLPDDPDQTALMRWRICRTNDQFFRNDAVRENALWFSARSWVRSALSKDNFLTSNPNCEHPLRMCM